MWTLTAQRAHIRPGKLELNIGDHVRANQWLYICVVIDIKVGLSRQFLNFDSDLSSW